MVIIVVGIVLSAVAVVVGIWGVVVMIRNAHHPQPVVVTNPQAPAVTDAASHRMIRNLIDELEANYEMLQHVQYATTASLHDEAWTPVVSENVPEIADALRTQLNNCYINIRAAKGVQKTIENVRPRPDGSMPDTNPELFTIYQKLEKAKQGIPEILRQLKDLSMIS